MSTNSIERFIENIFKVSLEEKNRHFVATTDSTLWYKTRKSDCTMFTPSTNVLRVNMLALDSFLGAVETFLKFDLEDSRFKWTEDTLNLFHASGMNVQKGLLDLKFFLESLPEGHVVACDIETRDLSWDRNKLLSIGFATDDSTCYAFSGITTYSYSTLESCLNLPNIRYCWHNGKFDISRLWAICGIKARIDEDTELKHFVQLSEKKGTHKLKSLGPIYLQAPQWDDELDAYKKQFCKTHKKPNGKSLLLEEFKYDMLPINTLIPYMQRDCLASRRLLSVFDELKEPGTDWIYSQLITAANVFAQIELSGAFVDILHIALLEEELTCDLEDASRIVAEGVKHYWNPIKYRIDTNAKGIVTEFNMNSPAQLKWLIKQAIGFDPGSTDADTIDKLVSDIESGNLQVSEYARSMFDGIKKMRKADKYLNTYVYGIQKARCADGRIRGGYNLHGTETGRLSSSNPNMQNIPRNKHIKNIFCASPGNTLLQLDQSQAELRVMAYHTNDPHLVGTYQRGEDLHATMAEAIFGPNWTEEQRSISKTVNFGIPYGRGPGALVESKDFNVTFSQARQIVDDWLRANAIAKKWMDAKRREARKGVRQQTTFGRVRHYVVDDKNMYHVENNYINTPIQADASDLTLFALIDIYHWLVDAGLYIPWHPEKSQVRMAITVHDSIVMEVPNDAALYEVIALNAKRIMEEVPNRLLPNLTFPFRADIEMGTSWGKLSKYSVINGKLVKEQKKEKKDATGAL